MVRVPVQDGDPPSPAPRGFRHQRRRCSRGIARPPCPAERGVPAAEPRIRLAHRIPAPAPCTSGRPQHLSGPTTVFTSSATRSDTRNESKYPAVCTRRSRQRTRGAPRATSSAAPRGRASARATCAPAAAVSGCGSATSSHGLPTDLPPHARGSRRPQNMSTRIGYQHRMVHRKVLGAHWTHGPHRRTDRPWPGLLAALAHDAYLGLLGSAANKGLAGRRLGG